MLILSFHIWCDNSFAILSSPMRHITSARQDMVSSYRASYIKYTQRVRYNNESNLQSRSSSSRTTMPPKNRTKRQSEQSEIFRPFGVVISSNQWANQSNHQTINRQRQAAQSWATFQPHNVCIRKSVVTQGQVSHGRWQQKTKTRPEWRSLRDHSD